MAATYCTVAEVQNTTRNTELSAANSDTVTSYIEQAELMIDSYVGFIYKQSESQSRKFPQVGDDANEIPENVKFATIYQVEYMWESQPDLEHGESDDDGDANRRGRKFNLISGRAKQLLKNVRNIVGEACVDRSYYKTHDELII